MDRRLQTTDQRVRFRIDATRCDGQGVCVLVAPEVFALDRYETGYVRADAGQAIADREVRDRALEASALCPRNAIFEQVLVPVAATAGEEPPAPAAAPPAAADPVPRRLLTAPGEVESLDDWVAKGGFADVPGEDVTATVRAAGVAGQGGAMFGTANKWSLTRRDDAVLVLNGAEREPGTVKDRYLLEHRPALVLDGLRLAARAVGASLVVVAIDAGATAARTAFAALAEQAAGRGLLDGLELRHQEVPERYVAGEESALLRLIESGRPLPRLRPPFPGEVGLYGRPTVVNNVETLADVALAQVLGPDAYRSVGTTAEPGTGLFSVGPFGGPVTVVERPLGYPLSALLAETGHSGARAVLVGGYAGALIGRDRFDVTLDAAALRAAGASLGTKSVQVLGDEHCPVGVVADIVGYFAGETADQCPPCSRGLPDMAATLRALEDGTPAGISVKELEQFVTTLFDRGVCRLPDGAARVALSLLHDFADEVAAHREHGCPHRSGRPLETATGSRR